MALFKSGNPALSEKMFDRAIGIDHSGLDIMTERGTLNKFGLMLLLLLAAAGYAWKAAAEHVNIGPWILATAIGGFIVAMVLIFRPKNGPYLAPIYALLEGFFLGGISAYYNDAFAKVAPGIVMQAVGLTFGVVIAMFILYRTGIIKATQRFRSIVFVATAGIAVFYGLSILLGFFGVHMPLINDSTNLGIGFSLIVVGIAALNLILDFDMIEQGVAKGAPKYMEWYGAFGLMVTIVWLYIEILRLLGKMANRR